MTLPKFHPDAFLRFASRECSMFLYLHWNAGGDARRAALLSLHGAGLGFWRLSKNDFRAACEVAGARSDGSAIRAVKRPKGKCSAATYRQACEDLQDVFDQDAADAAKLNAVEAFFKIVGWISPDDLAALVAEQEIA